MRFAIIVRVAMLLMLLAHLWSNAYASEYEFLMLPIDQLNDVDCQSYSLALALALADSEDKYAPLGSVYELALLEEYIWRDVETKKKKTVGSTWNQRKAVLMTVTAGEYSQQDLIRNTFSEVIDHIRRNLEVVELTDTNEILRLDRPIQTTMLSVKRIGPDLYGNGHIITILGIAPDNASYQYVNPPLLVVNSYVTGGTCRPVWSADADKRRHRYGQVDGYTGWIYDYEPNVAPDGKYYFAYICKEGTCSDFR